ncbi:MAG: hypothetical protein GY711_10180 [bacterium]|nr:hypothetical protein [bacterium]
MQNKTFPLFAFLFTAPALGQIDVAVVASDQPYDCYVNDIPDKLIATGHFNTVDYIGVRYTTPTLQELLPYDAVITYTNFPYADSVAFGNVMADYVDAGGGVVVGMFAHSDSYTLEGRWQPDYQALLQSAHQFNPRTFLGTLHEPGHPLLDGVQTFDGGNRSYRPTQTNLTPGSRLIAEWGDGSPLVVLGPMPQRVDLGFYLLSTGCSSGGWQEGSDGDLLMANALLFAAGYRHDLYCSPAQANSTGGPARISTTGSADVAASDLVLVAEDLPPGEFGYFLVGSNQGQVQPPGSQGTLCLSCSGFQGCAGIGRFSQAGQIVVGPTGSLLVDLGALPLTPPVTVQVGETWNFQCWYRDLGSSNFSDAVSVVFR